MRNVNIRPAEKTIMFGNKIDGLEDQGKLNEKIGISESNGQSHSGKTFLKSRLSPGSARAHWHENDKTQKSAQEKLKFLGHDDGFDNLYAGINVLNYCSEKFANTLCRRD